MRTGHPGLPEDLVRGLVLFRWELVIRSLPIRYMNDSDMLQSARRHAEKRNNFVHRQATRPMLVDFASLEYPKASTGQVAQLLNFMEQKGCLW